MVLEVYKRIKEEYRRISKEFVFPEKVRRVTDEYWDPCKSRTDYMEYQSALWIQLENESAILALGSDISRDCSLADIILLCLKAEEVKGLTLKKIAELIQAQRMDFGRLREVMSGSSNTGFLILDNSWFVCGRLRQIEAESEKEIKNKAMADLSVPEDLIQVELNIKLRSKKPGIRALAG